jgi:lytic murein transglycosylase
MKRFWAVSLGVAGIFLATVTSAAAAASCGGDFGQWLTAMKKDAAGAGISQKTIAAALDGITPDAAILALDRKQGYFKQSFETYRAKRVPPAMVQAGRARVKQLSGLLGRIEQRFGVPGPVLVAIWGLETGFGAGSGNTPAIRSLATLAHDCRRADFFRGELIAALQVADRGDLAPAAMRGGWAGELGQTQFMPSSYLRFAVDFDGDGRRDLIHSPADALASTANYLKGYGWKAGAPWGEGTANYGVLTGWNKAEVYRRTIVYFAKLIAGGDAGL